MRKLRARTGIAAGLVAAATGLSFGLPIGAHADTAPRNGDVVGVGSDTLQNGAAFLFDGAPGVAGGYNNIGNLNRVFSFDATGDANGRATYDGTCGTANASTGLGTFCGQTSDSAPNLLPSTVILRTGTNPVTRPNGSGAGVAALIADASGGAGYQGLPTGSIQFARMSRLPNSTEEGNCPTTGACGGLHVYQFATDQLEIAVQKSATDAPAGLSAAELVKIYTCQYTKWGDIPGYSGSGASATIHPLIPQSGSGTRNFFLADLTAANSGATVTPGTCVRTVEEHDPTGIYADPTPQDAIEPFSTGKISLINSGYFQNAGYATSAGNNAYSKNYLTTLTGTAPDKSPAYDSSRGLYFVIRNSDLASTTGFQPGTSGAAANFANVLFAGSQSVIAKSANQSLIAAAGFTPAYKDCGVNPTSC